MARERKGSKRKLDYQEIELYVKNNPDTKLSTIGNKFEISGWHAGRILKKLGYSYKKKAFTYVEASGEKRAKYIEEIKLIAEEEFVFVDESGIDMSICKDREWGLKSKKLIGKKSGSYYQRTNIIAGLNMNKPIAPMIFNGSCNTALFNKWVEEFLIKELQAGQVVIMDNAAFHKSAKTKELIESVGCRVIFLPPYSPDLNPIEKFWANMKRCIKDRISQFDRLFDAITNFFIAPNLM